MRQAIYVRVSTTDQETDIQKDAIKNYLKDSYDTAMIFEEKISGKSGKHRPEFIKMMDAVKRNEIETIIVYKLDRFARSTIDFLNAHQTMEEHGCKFISISDSLDFSTPMGRMFAQLLAIFAEFERSAIIARTTAGLHRAKANGVKFGPKPRQDIDWDLIKTLRTNGHTYQHIANRLKIPKTTIIDGLARQSAA